MNAQRLELIITDLHRLKRSTLWVTLTPPPSTALPPWTPGAHIGVQLTDDLVRHYSLCGDAADQGVYRIAVQLDADSRGGSRWIHENWEVGQTVSVEPPRNDFALVEADSYLFIAGGIGITPLLPMIKQAEDEGRSWSLGYRGHQRAEMPFAGALLKNLRESVSILASDEGHRETVRDIMGAPVAGRAIYCCGPTSMLDEAEEIARSGALAPGETMHIERFSNPDAGPTAGDQPFELELAASGTTLTVPADRTIIDVLQEHGMTPSFSCLEGTCGTCEVPVLSGEVDHRDSILDDDEKAANDCMFICVSRSACPKLVIDL